MLQIRRGTMDNLGVSFHVTPSKCMLQPIIRIETILMRGHKICFREEIR